MDQTKNEDEDFSDSDDLLYSSAYGLRKFHINSSIMYGVMLEETDDSFLVAMPAFLSKKGEDIILEEVSHKNAFVRVLKSSVSFVTFSQPGSFESVYLEFIRVHSVEIFPELMDMIGESAEGTDDWKLTEASQRQLEIQTQAPPEPRRVEGGGVLVDGPFTKEELKDKIAKASKEGCILPPPESKLPN